jgi:hypothetical protein
VSARTIRLAVPAILPALAMFHVVFTAPVVSAQKMADEPTHREAIQHFRTGQELMSAEQFGVRQRSSRRRSTSIRCSPLRITSSGRRT